MWFPQTQVCEMLAVLLSDGEEREVWKELGAEDAAAVREVMARAGKRKTSKRKKVKPNS